MGGSGQVFGQINDKTITSIELKFNEGWHKYAVSYPGYIIRLKDFNGTIEDYRFLNRHGNIVWK